jgi:hypothetical protein
MAQTPTPNARHTKAESHAHQGRSKPTRFVAPNEEEPVASDSRPATLK